MRRFEKGDKVLTPWISRWLPLGEVLKVFDSADGEQVLLVEYIESAQLQKLFPAAQLDYIGNRKFIALGVTIYRISNGEAVAESKNWAPVIADFLETFKPPFPGEAESQPEPIAAHDDWRELNGQNKCGLT